MRSPVRSHATRFAFAVTISTAVLGVASPLSAQTSDPRWQAWIGCWVPSGGSVDERFTRSSAQRVCITPATSGPGVDIVTIDNGKTIATERLEATGARVARTRDGCEGWEQANWSPDAHRITLRSEFTCAGGAVRKSSGLFAFTPAGAFLQVHGLNVSGNVSVRAAVFDEAAFDSLGASVIGVPATGFATLTARMAASSELSADDVIDVAKHVDAPVAQAWLTEIGQGFDLDAKQLVRLADAGIPPRMIDLMVALSNPRSFVIQKAGSGGIERVNTVASRSNNGRGAFPMSGYGAIPMGMWPNMGWGMAGFDPFFPGDGLGLYSNRYFGNGNGFFGNGFFGNGFFGNGFFGNGYYGNNPIVIVNRGDAAVRPEGRAVNGAGYTRPQQGTSGTSGRSDYVGSGGYRSGGSSSGGSSSGGSSSAGSSSGGGTSSGGASTGGGGRTAQPRPPGN